LLSWIKRSVESAAGANLASSLIRLGARSLWNLALPTLLSVGQFAIYSLWQTTSMILAQLGVLGAPQVVMRSEPRTVPLYGIFAHAALLIVVGTLLALLVVPGQDGLFYGAILIGALATAAGLMVTTRAKSMMAFKRVAKVEAVGGVILFALGLPLVVAFRASSESLWFAIAIDIVAIVPALVILTVGASRLADDERRLSLPELVLRPTYSIGFLVLLDVLLLRRIEVYFLASSPDGLRAIAVFALAAQMANLLMIVPSAILEAWFPQIAAASRESAQSVLEFWRQRRIRYSALYVALFGGSVPALWLLTHVVVPKYEHAFASMLCIVASRLVSGYAGIYSTMLYASSSERSLYLPAILGAIVALALNSTLTLSNGLDGLLVAYAITHVFVAIATYVGWRVARA
jgi:O-antigen/teichoic acid export membrane protein